MNFIIKNAYADAVEIGAATPSTVKPTAESPKPAIDQTLTNFLPLIVIFVLFYFMLIRPQMKKQKEHQNLLGNLKTGDKVVLNSGMIGTLVKIEDDKNYVQVEIAQNVKVRMLKSAISDVMQDEKAKDKKIEENKE
ncbi:MAG: preprotein translocase subunit YajC [Sphingobacteriia bacterium]|nr:preprotein translocase subunit YajC [Sphingobacteriia bacterium]